MRAVSVALLALSLAAALSACGGGSSDASTLLKQTFSGPHTVNSGNLSLTIRVTPAAAAGGAPILLSFGGPFQSQGPGKLPKSDFNIRLNARGAGGQLSVLSTGTAGYVTVNGTSYRLPPSAFRKLESSFSGLATSQGRSGSNLSGLGIHPLGWLSDPKVVGDESVGGAQTTHIRATINVPALLGDLNTFLHRASSSSAQIPAALSPATQARLSQEIENPTFDVWTGKQDKTIRRLSIGVTVSLGATLAQLVGAGRAQVGLTMQYADLNQPQTISTPTNVQPFSRFQASLRTLLGQLQSRAGGLAGSGTTGTSTTPGASTSTTPGASTNTTPATTGTNATGTTPGASTGASSRDRRYSQCILNAHGDIGKMQACASLINGH